MVAIATFSQNGTTSVNSFNLTLQKNPKCASQPHDMP